MRSSKKVVIIILTVLTLALAVVSGYVAWRLSRETAPEESGAAIRQKGDVCAEHPETTIYTCARFECTLGCGSDGQCGSGDVGAVYTESCASLGTACGQLDYLNAAGQYCEYGELNCGGDCAGTDEKPVQKNPCGGSCSVDGDCIDESSYGVDIVCRNNRCVNSLCPNDTGAEGTLCVCTEMSVCGERCGAGSSKGLCGDGRSVCTYVTGPSCAATNNNTYCVPTDNPDVARPKCVARDTGNSYLRLISNPSKVSFTAAEIMELCNWRPAAVPLCGDGLCNSTEEKCESETPTSTTSRACTAGDFAAQRAPTGAIVDCRGDENDQAATTLTCKYCGDGIRQSTEQCDYAVDANCNNDCTQQVVVNLCTSMGTSAAEVRSGTGNFVEYTLVYRHSSTSNPFPTIRLRVSDPAVGRDANATSAQLVTPYSYAFDPATLEHTYRFRWEASDPSGTAVANGTYDVRVLRDGSADMIAEASCQTTLVVDAANPENPLFVINKQSSPVCDSNGDEVITYTVTVRNIGPVEGVIDWVEDRFDQTLLTLGITPTNINPTYGQIIAGTNRISWVGSLAERTFAPNQSKQYSYQIRIPHGQLVSFVSNGVLNQAEVQYDTNETTDNTASFNLRTMLTCALPVVPVTGIGDDLGIFLMVGLLMIFAGVVIYRYRLSQGITENIILKGLDKVGIIPGEAFERRTEEKLDRKAKRQNAEK